MPHNLSIYSDGKERKITCPDGAVLLDILKEQGITIDAPCNGKGTCGKCRVIYEGPGTADEGEIRLIGKKEAQRGVRLACRCKIVSDATVHIAPQSSMNVQTWGRMEDISGACRYRAVEITLIEPTVKEQIDDETNLVNAIKTAIPDIGEVTADFGILNRVSNFRARGVKEFLCVLSNGRVLDIFEDKQSPVIGVGVDIGTTTVAAYYYDMRRGAHLYTASGVNAQRMFGADVISRIQHTMEKKDGLDVLKGLITDQLSKMSMEFCKVTGIAVENIYAYFIAGNTTMQHIAAGLDPASIASAPFIPLSLFGGIVSGDQLGLAGNKRSEVYFVPAVASYVGGDITAGILASGMMHKGENALLLDIGTNGEMALLCGGELVCCSTAAGPAFEGAHIRFGMGGGKGAINTVTLEGDEIRISVIGGGEAVGICGSGIIDAVGIMLDSGALDETGRICDQDEADPVAAPRIIETPEGESAFLIDEEKGIYLTQKDIREVQLAKAAIAAGITTMLHSVGIDMSKIDRIYIAGGFGSFIDKKSAARIGLLPSGFDDRIEVIGNGAGAGAVMALLSSEYETTLLEIGKKARYIELSGDPYFQDEYIEKMCFE